jgi:hypothetical protein
MSSVKNYDLYSFGLEEILISMIREYQPKIVDLKRMLPYIKEQELNEGIYTLLEQGSIIFNDENELIIKN